MANNQVVYVSTADLNLPMEDLYRAMGYGDVVPEEELCALCKKLLTEACQVAKPRFYYSLRECEIGSVTIDTVNSIGGVDHFEAGKTISGLMKRSSMIAIFVATAGEEFQEWMDKRAIESEILETFIIDSIGSMMVEATGDYMELYIEKDPLLDGLKHTNRFSPGYCGWNIVEQHKLFGTLPDKVCSISLTDSSLMHPIKSISGFVGVGESVITKKYGCSICNRLDCYLRKK